MISSVLKVPLNYRTLPTVHFFFKRNHVPFEAIITSLMKYGGSSIL